MSRVEAISYKYGAIIGTLPNCPPSSYSRADRSGFRYVFKHGEPEKSFLPVLVKQPGRMLSLRTDKTSQCRGYGLSFFSSLESARKRFTQIKKRHPKIQKTLGDHIATGPLNTWDGVMSNVDGTGHFTLHEFKDVRLHLKFTIVCSVA
jgi:hypothetical protein